MSRELYPDQGIQPLREASSSGPIRPQGSMHRQSTPSSHPSNSASRSGPYSRPDQSSSFSGSSHTVKASSTTSEFTKRKNWSQHIIDEIQDFMHVLSPTGSIMFCTPSIRELTGWTPEEAVGKPISDFIHADDIEGFSRDFQNSLRDGNDLTLYYRFRMKDDRYIIFEITGHPYYAEENGQQQCKCFFAMGRPYPSKNTAMLDSFLELKIENERLRQELHDMYTDMESGGDGTGQGGRGSPIDYGPPSNIDYSNSRRSSNPYQAGLQQYDRSPQLGGSSGLVLAHGPANNSASHGALGIGISNTGNKGDMSGGSEKKKKARVEEGEFVCRDCGTVDSPEWRKGPEGPKSLCNACGLRYAKLKSKGDKLDKKK